MNGQSASRLRPSNCPRQPTSDSAHIQASSLITTISSPSTPITYTYGKIQVHRRAATEDQGLKRSHTIPAGTRSEEVGDGSSSRLYYLVLWLEVGMLVTQCTGHREEARGFEYSGIYSSSIFSTWFILASHRSFGSGPATLTLKALLDSFRYFTVL